jgi:hypothetical protein
MNWQPDLSPSEFQRVLQSETYPPMPPLELPGLQVGAWYGEPGTQSHVRIPWRRFTDPTGNKVWGQCIKAHDTHRLVVEGIHPIHNSILDVGGYDGIWAWLFAAERKVVLDICQEALERWAAIHATEIVCEDGGKIGKLYQENEFDVVFLIDVLEHMKATTALRAVQAAEKIAKYQVVVATPDGWWPFDDWQSIITKDSDVPCVENMAHKSGWGHEFFLDRGYDVTIQPGLHSDLGMGDGLVAFYNK